MSTAKYRLYVDEAGDHTIPGCLVAPHKRYLGLFGVAFETVDHAEFRKSLEQLKQRHLAYDEDDPPVLHREDILGKAGPFSCFKADQEKLHAFCNDLIDVPKGARWISFCVVIDKESHGSKSYRRLKHPYHYCFHVLLERFHAFLVNKNAIGDVMVESRGGREDGLLKQEYQYLLSRGSNYCRGADFRDRFSSNELKVKKKQGNVAGLQLSDLLAYSATRDVLLAYKRVSPPKFNYLDQKLVELVRTRYMTMNGRTDGWGRVILD